MQLARSCRLQFKLRFRPVRSVNYGNLVKSHPVTYHRGTRQHGTQTPDSFKSRRTQATRNDRVDLEQPRHIRSTTATNDVDSLVDAYNHLLTEGGLSAQDLSALGRQIRDAVRSQLGRPETQDTLKDKERIVSFLKRIIQDVVAEKLAASPIAYVHILEALQQAGAGDIAIDFWQWLEQQEDQYLNHNVYAAAIRLLTAEDVPLHDLEELYQAALTRFPGSFMAYHLSPDAIVADRDKAVAIGKDSMFLLQAIALARLSRGDTQNAYIALDTALRLFPTDVSPKFFAPFVTRRPLVEAFTTFAIACRSGQSVSINLFRQFFANIHSSSRHDSLQSHIVILRAMLAALYMYLGAGGQVKHYNLGELVITITQILRLPEIGELVQQERDQIVERVVALVKKSFVVFARYGVTPPASAMNSIILNVGGHGRSRETILAALADMEGLGLKPDKITRRSVLVACGLLGNEQLVQEAWYDIVELRDMENSFPDFLDFAALLKAARYTDLTDFTNEQFQTFKQRMNASESSKVENLLVAPLPTGTARHSGGTADLDLILSSLLDMDADFSIIDHRTRNVSEVQDFSEMRPPARLLPFPRIMSLPESEMRELYDEFSTEQRRPADSESKSATSLGDSTVDGEPETSSTNLTYGTLRYENWKDMNYLLSMAEAYDEKYSQIVAKAVSNGEQPRAPNLSLTRHEIKAMEKFGLSTSPQLHAAQTKVEGGNNTETDEYIQFIKSKRSRAKAEILRLRRVKASLLS